MALRTMVGNAANTFQAIRNRVTGKSITSLRYLYDTRFPPTKFLLQRKQRIHIQCILSGFPRAGSHWIRNVVEKSSGQATFELEARQITYETKNICIVKIHARNKLMARTKALWLLPYHHFGGQYIYVYRDPRDAILSLYEMYMTVKGVTLTPEQFLRLYDPIRQYRWEIGAWVLPKHKDVFVVKYEDLKAEPQLVFARILTYLGLDVRVDSQAIAERVAMADHNKRPRGIAYAWKNAPEKYTGLLNIVTEQLQSEIDALGYDL